MQCFIAARIFNLICLFISFFFISFVRRGDYFKSFPNSVISLRARGLAQLGWCELFSGWVGERMDPAWLINSVM